MRDLAHVLFAATRAPWAIRPDYAEIVAGILSRHLAGIRLSDWEAEQVGLARAATEARRDGDVRASVGGIAVVPVLGVLSARAGMMAQQSGMTSHEQIGAALEAAERDPDVGTIVLDVNSPGGTVAGTPELAAQIRGLSKPVVAHVNYMAASAAYWLATQADEVIVSPSAEVGSIGVVQMHRDVSAAAEKDGVKVSFVSAGRFKTEGNSFEPLSDPAREYAQRQVDAAYTQFVGDVAKGRGVSRAVASGPRFGEGRVLNAQDAKEAGMVDRIESFSETIARLAAGGRTKKRMRAEVVLEDDPAPVAPPTIPALATPVPALEDVDLYEVDLLAREIEIRAR